MATNIIFNKEKHDIVNWYIIKNYFNQISLTEVICIRLVNNKFHVLYVSRVQKGEKQRGFESYRQRQCIISACLNKVIVKSYHFKAV